MPKKWYCYIICAVFIGKFSFAQKNISFKEKEFFIKTKDSLEKLTDSISKIEDDALRINLNVVVVKTLLEALKRPYSFNYGLDSLTYISVQKARNNSFRIITWYLPVGNGFKFYGTIQMNTPNGQLKLFPLTDATATIADTNQPLSHKNWYGTRYYQMIPVNGKGKPTYYLLLGWKGNNNQTSKKVIDALSFENGMPVFGKKIFETSRKTIKSRMIFEYNAQNAMTLFYDKKENLICFDHLVPLNPDSENDFEFYGSDSTFDGYVVTYPKLILKQDIELKNDPNELDDKYIEPTKASKLLKKEAN